MEIIVKKETVVKPVASNDKIISNENYWKRKLPQSYKDFLKENNGGIPLDEKSTVMEGKRERLIERFLNMVDDPNAPEFDVSGWYWIPGVMTQIGERLITNPEYIGDADLIPIAVLFGGDHLCLDYREDIENPTVSVWSHEESEDFAPVAYVVADSFDDLINNKLGPSKDDM